MIEFLAIVAVTTLLAAVFDGAPRRRAGCRVNDLGRWKQYGGTLDRPNSPGRSASPQSKEDAA